MKRILPVILTLCLLLCACANAPAEQTTETPVNTTETLAPEPTTEPTTVPATKETTAPTEPTVVVEVVNYRNPLNGMPMDEPCTARPYAVVINNIRAAQPMCSIFYADMVFEALAEGGITRWLALYDDISDLYHIGAIRSARPYFVDVACGYDAIFVHHGGSQDGYSRIWNLDVDDLDPMTHGGGCFYRDQTRLDDGYALEHTSFADGADLMEEAVGMEYATVREEGVDYGYQFADLGSTADGQDAKELTIVFGGYGKTTLFTYSEDTGNYVAEQYGDFIIDGNSYEKVSYRNVLLITTEVYTYENNDGVRTHITSVGEGTGFFACDGKVVPIKWSRAGDEEPYVFTHEDGTPITLGVGSTYVAVTPLTGTMEYE